MSVHRIIKFNLPDGLWLYASLNALIIIQKGDLNRPCIFWLSYLIIISFGSEILQYFKILNGTFDLCDLFAYTIAVFFSSLNLKFYHIFKYY